MNKALTHYYRQARQHQLNTYGLDGLHIPDGKGGFRSARQFTGGGAAYQNHAIAAFYSAKGAIRFRADLAKKVKQHKKRSAAAKKGWKKRRAA